MIIIENNKQRKKREYNYQFRYGISYFEYESMKIKQQGRCFICQITKDKLVVDHCHKTKSVRKLLCQNCNAGLGMLFEDEFIINNLLKYVKKYKKNK